MASFMCSFLWLFSLTCAIATLAFGLTQNRLFTRFFWFWTSLKLAATLRIQSCICTVWYGNMQSLWNYVHLLDPSDKIKNDVNLFLQARNDVHVVTVPSFRLGCRRSGSLHSGRRTRINVVLPKAMI